MYQHSIKKVSAVPSDVVLHLDKLVELVVYQILLVPLGDALHLHLKRLVKFMYHTPYIGICSSVVLHLDKLVEHVMYLLVLLGDALHLKEACIAPSSVTLV